MSEIYIYSQDDKLLTILSGDTGAESAKLRDEINQIPSEPFTLELEAEHDVAKHVKDENQVVFRDKHGDLLLYTIKEIDDLDTGEGATTTATCFPAFKELENKHVIERRFENTTAQVALNAIVQGTRWTGSVDVSLGRASTHFYWLNGLEGISRILEVWGGDLKPTVTLDANNNITSRHISIVQRRGSEKGQVFEIDHNTSEIGRTVLSYPVTALFGRGSSLPIEDEDGEATGGHTRYIGFEDVEWRVSKGDPVDKPLGQRWVGDPNALNKYGLKQGSNLIHREGIWQDHNIEDPEELLHATWQMLQDLQKPEITYRLSADLFDEDVALGDTAFAIDRKFARPIEIQARVIALEYDVLDPDNTLVVEMGQFLNLGDDRIRDLERKVEDLSGRQPVATVTPDSYPNRKPSAPIGLSANGAHNTIQVMWEPNPEIYVKQYELYGSQLKDFVPSSATMLHRTDGNSFAHAVETDEVWYYRVRALNYQGMASDYSEQVQGQSVRILTEDIVFGPDMAYRLRELNRISGIVDEIGFDQISEHARDMLGMEARRYTDEEIRNTRTDLLGNIESLSDDLQLIEDKLVDKVNVGDVYTKHEISEEFLKYVSVIAYDTDMNGVVNQLSSHSSLIEQTEVEINKRVEQIEFDNVTGYLENSISQVINRADGIEQTVSNIRIGGTNLSSIDKVQRWNGTIQRNGYVYTLTSNEGASTGHRAGIYIDSSAFEIGKSYVLSFKIKKTSGTIYAIAGHNTAFTNGMVYIDGEYVSNNWSTATPYPDDEETREIKVLITSTNKSGTAGLYIQPNRNDYASAYVCEIWDLQVEEGNQQTAWRPPFEDTDQRMTQAESSITQLADSITLKVGRDEIISRINLSPESITLKSSLIVLDGLSTIREAVIKNAHIDNLSAAKVTFGTMLGDRIQANTLNGNRIIANTITTDHLNVSTLAAITANLGEVTGGRITQSSSGRRLEMFGGEIESYSNNRLAMKFGQFSLNFYNRNETLLGQIVPLTNENNSTYEGLGLIVENDFINIGMRQGGFIRPVLRSSFYDNTTILSGPYNNANAGASLQMFANRRLVSENRFGSYDQPSIILDQSDTTNDIDVNFGGFGRRTNASVYFRHRNTSTSSQLKMRVAPTYVRIYDELRVGSENTPIGIYPFANNVQWRYDINNYIRQQSNGRVDIYSANRVEHTFDSNGNATHNGNLDVGGSLRVPAAYTSTTPNGVNVHVFADTGRFARSTSARKYKRHIEIAHDVDYNKILELNIKSWYDKNELINNGGSTEGLQRYYGLIANEFEEIGLPQFAVYVDGEIEQYSDRAWVNLIPILRDVKEEQDWQRLEHQILKNEYKKLLKRVEDLEEMVA